MNPLGYERAGTEDDAIRSIGAHGAMFLGGGTNLIDLMKLDVEKPTTLVDVTKLELTKVEPTKDGGLMIGALVRNSDLANHPMVVENYPLLSQALLSGASPQLRNMATTGGNLLQRTRCYYFTDTAFPACNKRVPGSGCAAIEGFNRIHAILGQSDHGPKSGQSCIATNPSDMCVAMAALGAKVHVKSAKGARVIPFSEFHRLPGTTPEIDTHYGGRVAGGEVREELVVFEGARSAELCVRSGVGCGWVGDGWRDDQVCGVSAGWCGAEAVEVCGGGEGADRHAGGSNDVCEGCGGCSGWSEGLREQHVQD
jgi:CO/xanthine dehydrogenase FAD-binding subunit